MFLLYYVFMFYHNKNLFALLFTHFMFLSIAFYGFVLIYMFCVGFKFRFVFSSFIFIIIVPMIVWIFPLGLHLFVIDRIWFFGVKCEFLSSSNYNKFIQILWMIHFLELWLRLWITHLLSKSHFTCFCNHVYIKKKN